MNKIQFAPGMVAEFRLGEEAYALGLQPFTGLAQVRNVEADVHRSKLVSVRMPLGGRGLEVMDQLNPVVVVAADETDNVQAGKILTTRFSQPIGKQPVTLQAISSDPTGVAYVVFWTITLETR